MGNGAWGMGHREWGVWRINNQCPILWQLLEMLFAFAQYKCPMPNAQCPMPNAQFPIPICLKYVPDEKFSAAIAHFPLEITNCKGNFGQLLHATITRMPKNACVFAIAAISAPSDRKLVYQQWQRDAQNGYW
ncbi:MAG: hypothetical protein V7L11_05955 [Nostoc sp.]|uniref:hypothetical protein n=1 Tax=Nostoc sp. TaxID=1180 RepID=UPI002FFB3FF6